MGHPDFDIDLSAVARAWDQTMRVDQAHRTVASQWYHGDLNAENLLVGEGRLVAVLDFGGLSVGDPTIDLVVAWQLLDPAARTTFRDALTVDDATWSVARGWVLVLAMMGLPYYWDTMRDRCLRGLAMARQALAEPAEPTRSRVSESWTRPAT
jgi:aminoglycoside phosphotransferase (APT) family kinase protein